MSGQMAHAMLQALEERLRRLELLLHGDESRHQAGPQSDEQRVQQSRPAHVRLAKIEQRLADLRSHSSEVDELLTLHARLPELDGGGDDNAGSGAKPAEASISLADQQTVVLASADMISAAASRLTALESVHMPDSGPLTELAVHHPRLLHAQDVQNSQAYDMETLRKRTTLLLGQWYEQAVLDEGEQWVNWEHRLARVEQHIRRTEHQRNTESTIA